MPPAKKKKNTPKPTVRSLHFEVSSLRRCQEDLEDARDLRAAIQRHQNKPGTSWNKAKVLLGLD